MPLYDYHCTKCDLIFERKLAMADHAAPTKEPCPTCTENTVEQYLSAAPALGDPIKLGFTRPPDAFLHGVLGRMQNSCPVGTEKDKRGVTKVKYADFSKAHYQPGRMV